MIEVLANRTLYNDGHHNAWTDIALFQGRYYVTFHNGNFHHGGGRSVYMRSAEDTDRVWSEPMGFFGIDRMGVQHHGITKFFVFDDRLFVAFMARAGDRYQTFIGDSPDGLHWQDAKGFVAFPKTNTILWRARVHEGALYATFFDMHVPLEVKGRLAQPVAHLRKSTDGFHWEDVSDFAGGSQPGLIFREDGELVSTARSADAKQPDLLARSRPPYTEWTYEPLGFQVHSSYLAEVGGRIILCGREFGHSRSTFLREYVDGAFGDPVVLAWAENYSSGDTGYPGIVRVPGTDNELLVSYYHGNGKRFLPKKLEHDGRTYWMWGDRFVEGPTPFLQMSNICLAHVRVT